MKNLFCLFGRHQYPLSSLETKAVDERDGYLICRVSMCCNKCGEPFKDIIAVPITEWLQRERIGEEDA